MKSEVNWDSLSFGTVEGIPNLGSDCSMKVFLNHMAVFFVVVTSLVGLELLSVIMTMYLFPTSVLGRVLSISTAKNSKSPLEIIVVNLAVFCYFKDYVGA